MATTYKTAGIALLIVSVLGVAALGGVIFYKSEASENPDDILGIYSLYEYTQGGVGKDGNWHWYETGDGTYDGEKIILSEYKDGFVKGKAYLDGRGFDLYGTYDSPSGMFNYISYYDYTPGSSDKVVDILYGYIEDNMMVLTGYTVSATEADQAFAFNFVFFKDGVPAHDTPHYDDMNFGTITSTSATNVATDGKTTTLAQQTYSEIEFRNGVYKMMINGELAAAVTVSSGSGSAILKCVYVEDGSICTEWIGVERDGGDIEVYVFSNSTWDNSVDVITFNVALPWSTFGGTLISNAKVFSSDDSSVKEYRYVHTISSAPRQPCFLVENETLGFKYIVSNGNFTSCSTFHFEYDGTQYFGENIIWGDGTSNGMFVSPDGKIILVNELSES